MKVAILSALIGPYEWAKPVPPDLGVPAVMMTDDLSLNAPGWELQENWVLFPDRHPEWDPAATESMMEHKFWKCHPHLAAPDADVVIWLDASMTIVEPNFVKLCLEALGDDDWSVTPHPWRNCIYDEATFSGHLPRYNKPALDAQAAFYSSIGHPPNWGLFATGASVRRMTDQVKEIGEQWWHECTTRTHQDQVSLPVLFRLAEEKGFRWNAQMPWSAWWRLTEHGR